MKPIRVLTVGMTATEGGVENFLMSYCGRIDPEKVRFDFLTRYGDAAYPEKRDAIGKTYVIPRRSEDPAKYYREIRAFFEQHAREYDVIWDNECLFSDLTPLKMAAEFGIPVRIAHSHMPRNMDPSLKGKGRGLLHRLQRHALARYANVLWACSEESARWACPAMDLPFTIVPHAVDAADFRFDPIVRAEVRAHYDLTDCLVVGHVGRMQYQKNHAFLLEAFARLHQREPRARLMLVGDGPNLLRLEAKAVDLGVEKEVLFLGHRDDVSRLYQAFDMVAMPSRFEGLGMTAVEAQAAGLPCLLSDAFPKEAALTDDVDFLAPEDPDLWAERMLDMLENLPERPDTTQTIVRGGYDLTDAADRLANRFRRLTADKPSFKRRFLLAGEDTPEDALALKVLGNVQQAAAGAGFALVTPPQVRLDKKWWRSAGSLCRSVLFWGGLFFKLHHGDLLLLQYPLYPPETAPVTRMALHLLQWKGATLAAFVHDLNSLRLLPDTSFRWSDQELLPCFDRIIAQGGRMADYLVGQGVKAENIIPLPLFDWEENGPIPERTLSGDVCIAGDLSRKRSRYLHDLPRTSRIHWHLCGAGWKGKRGDLTWHGEAMTDLPGSFGLLWAGASTQLCTGAQGAYAMLSMPREMSLYLTQGLPLIVWKWSAAAAFVREEGVGLVVDTLADIPAQVKALTPAEYAQMAAHARAWGEKLRRGGMSREALDLLG